MNDTTKEPTVPGARTYAASRLPNLCLCPHCERETPAPNPYSSPSYRRMPNGNFSLRFACHCVNAGCSKLFDVVWTVNLISAYTVPLDDKASPLIAESSNANASSSPLANESESQA